MSSTSESEWMIVWNDSPGFEDRIIFRLIRNSDAAVLKEFSLETPEQGKLYYALQDWFQDGDRFYTLVKNEV